MLYIYAAEVLIEYHSKNNGQLEDHTLDVGFYALNSGKYFADCKSENWSINTNIINYGNQKVIFQLLGVKLFDVLEIEKLFSVYQDLLEIPQLYLIYLGHKDYKNQLYRELFFLTVYKKNNLINNKLIIFYQNNIQEDLTLQISPNNNKYKAIIQNLDIQNKLINISVVEQDHKDTTNYMIIDEKLKVIKTYIEKKNPPSIKTWHKITAFIAGISSIFLIFKYIDKESNSDLEKPLE